MDNTERFIARENIRLFRRQLATSTDEQQKRILRQLLAQEQERLAKLENVPAS
jgi:rubrerythrin